MRFPLLTYVLVQMTIFIFLIAPVLAVQKKLMNIINICKRNDPEISNCFCMNWVNVFPKLKDGAPEMNIVATDPLLVDNLKMDLTHAQSLAIAATLQNITVYGLSKGQTQSCGALMTSDGLQLSQTILYPEIVMSSRYQAGGKFLLFEIKATGDFKMTSTNMKVQSVFNSTRYFKGNQEHLIYKCKIINVTMDSVALHFSNVFGNDTKLNEGFNNLIKENLDMLYDDIKLMIFRSLETIPQKIFNDFHGTFPYDLLYPNV